MRRSTPDRRDRVEQPSSLIDRGRHALAQISFWAYDF
jgi:hypothetical protein